MIRLSHAPTPEALAKLESLEERRKAYIEKGQNLPDSVRKGYKHPIVKAVLQEETCGKCAYCESKVTHTYPGDVEHIVPKSKRPDLMLQLVNLTFSCSKCNTNKGDYYELGAAVINPYDEEPGDHLFALGPVVMRKPGDTVGEITQKKLDLNRIELVERRQERLEAVAKLIDRIAKTKNKGHQRILLEELLKECDRCKEYTFVVRAYVERALANERNVETIEVDS